MGFWNGILALDRLLQRVPSIIEIWFVEFLAVMIFSLAAGRLVDGYGFGACPPVPEIIDGFAYGAFAVGLALMAWVVRRILRPKVATVTWTPVFVARDVAGISHVPVPMRSATVRYQVLSSHPSYVLIHLEWEMAWRPVLAAVALMAACVLIPFAVAWITGA